MAESSTFDRIARSVTRWAGSPFVTAAAFGIILAWLLGGLYFGYSDTYNLLINTVTTCVTFCMVFIIQAGQNRTEAEIKAMLREMIEDLPDVDERRAVDRADEEAKR